jgi:hypothetical protein
MAAVLDPYGAGALMRAITAYEGQPLTRAALELSALLFRRPGNIRRWPSCENCIRSVARSLRVP